MKQRTKRNIAISLAIILVTAVVLMAICTDGFLNWNKYCVFGHDYNEVGKCIRCGKDKPIENEDESKADMSERFVFASAQQLAAAAPTGGGLTSFGSNYTFNGVVTQTSATSNPTSYSLDTDLNRHLSINQKYPTQNTTITLDGTGSFKIAAAVEDDYSADDFSDQYYVVYSKVGSSLWTKVYNATFKTGTSISVKELSIVGNGTYQVCLVMYRSGDTSDEYTRSDIFTVQYGKEQTLPANPTKTGYTFTGWYTDEACTNKYTDSTVWQDVTLYAGFRAHTYNIKFNANSGSGAMDNLPMTYDQAKNLPANAFTKEHYTFKGWATSANGNVVYSNGQSVKNLSATDNATVELFAVWERSEVSVSFIVDGKTTTQWIAIGSKVTLPTTPVKDGHNFIAWLYTDGTIYTDQTVSEDITLTAYFEIIQCTVTFIVDGEVYATYVCDWGTKLAEALKANELNNPLLVSVEDEYSRNF